MAPGSGLRERKKQATHKALSQAALRLALERGPDNVRVDDIAEAANVSPRTYNNYFSSREQAIVAAVVAERDVRVAAAIAARTDVPLADAVIEAIVEQYSDPTSHDPMLLILLTSHPALRNAYLEAATEMEVPLTAIIAERINDPEGHIAPVLSASVAAAIRIALQRWLGPTGPPPASALLVASGSLPELLRISLAPLAPALNAAQDRRPGSGAQGMPSTRRTRTGNQAV